MKKLKEFLKSYKSLLFYSTASLVMVSFLCFSLVDHYYFSRSTNINAAISNKQRIRLDVAEFSAPAPKSTTENAPQAAEKQKTLGQISVIIDKVGLNEDASEIAMQSAAEFAIALEPNLANLNEKAQVAAALGHKVYMKLPLEEKEQKELTKLAISNKNNEFRNEKNLEAILSKSKNIDGMLISETEIFSQSGNVAPILKALEKEDINIIYPAAKKEKFGDDKLPHPDSAKIDVRVDGDGLKFQELEAAALKNGYTIGIITATIDNLKALEDWRKTLDSKQLKLVPIVND